MTIHLSQLHVGMAFDVLLSICQINCNVKISCNIKITKTSALCSDVYFFIKTKLFSIILIIIFYFDICIKFTLSSQRWRNDNISFDVCFISGGCNFSKRSVKNLEKSVFKIKIYRRADGLEIYCFHFLFAWIMITWLKNIFHGKTRSLAFML